MKKWLLKLSLVAMTLLLLPIQAVQACCGFIIGRQLTKDGTTLFGRTEDYPYYPNGGKHNKNFVVVDAKNYKEGDQLEDESNGFTYPHAASEMKYTATYDSARGDGSNGAFGEHGFNEAGVSMTSTVTAILPCILYTLCFHSDIGINNCQIFLSLWDFHIILPVQVCDTTTQRTVLVVY